MSLFLQIVAFEFFLVLLAAVELSVSDATYADITHQLLSLLSLNSPGKTHFCLLSRTSLFADLQHGLQGFRRGHSGLVALKAVNTALIMLYCQSKFFTLSW